MNNETKWFETEKMINSAINKSECKIANHLRKTLGINRQNQPERSKREDVDKDEIYDRGSCENNLC